MLFLLLYYLARSEVRSRKTEVSELGSSDFGLLTNYAYIQILDTQIIFYFH